MQTAHFTSGQKVVHADRPEWGVGVVLSAQRTGDTDRLRIRFERVGLKTLAAPPASIRPAGDHHNGAASPAAAPGPAVKPDYANLLATLPEAATDPLSPLEARLGATLALYKFTRAGASLIDWAVARTGLGDPLAEFTRHDLEAAFARFEHLREGHLRSLVGDARRLTPEKLAGIAASAPEAGRRAFTASIARR